MSINHFSSDLPETVWWSQPQYHHHHNHHHNMDTPTKSGSGTTTASTTFWGNSPLHHHHHAATSGGNLSLSNFNFDLNNEDEEETVEEQNQERGDHQIPKEPMFEKPLTPSDVGKLNRLVIPKQHAEKYFPLNAAGGNETGPEKGLLLNFEDELGKPWRFRYSYWNSSQSYVLTKGWSRFVKEKKLDAGDIVVFERHRLDGERMFIGWRRRTSAVPTVHDSGVGCHSTAAAVGGGGGGWTRVYFNTSGHNNPYPDQQAHYNHHPRHGHGSGFPYQSDHYLHAAAVAGVGGGGVLQHKPTGGGANSKRLRLFGVNLECHQEPPEEVVDSDHHHQLSSTPPEGSSTSSSHGRQEAYYPFQYYSPKVHQAYFNHQNHMNINFTRDANQTR